MNETIVRRKLDSDQRVDMGSTMITVLKPVGIRTWALIDFLVNYKDYSLNNQAWREYDGVR